MQWQVFSAPSGVHPDDSIAILITMEETQGEEFVRAINFEGIESQTIEVTAGKFAVEGFVMRQFGDGHELAQFVIPETTKKIDKPWYTGGDELSEVVKTRP